MTSRLSALGVGSVLSLAILAATLPAHAVPITQQLLGHTLYRSSANYFYGDLLVAGDLGADQQYMHPRMQLTPDIAGPLAGAFARVGPRDVALIFDGSQLVDGFDEFYTSPSTADDFVLLDPLTHAFNGIVFVPQLGGTYELHGRWTSVPAPVTALLFSAALLTFGLRCRRSGWHSARG